MSPEIVSQLASLLPAGTMIVVIPAGAGANPTPATATASPESESLSPSTGPGPTGGLPGESLLAPFIAAGDQADLTSNWGRVLKGVVSARELARAVEYGALPASVRGSGRGHNATVVKPSDIRKFLRVLASVEAGEITHLPSWWSPVRRRAA